ncbi:LysR family transcriptional regulator [Pseudomonas sp. HR96]|uniref:LysR family transcriptional regulator n=1 Tax=Pseudomonas sp. HR96 TaxID=1027966 RepID=UPI002A76338E|nr:LysR family transcriptional regulator [Pseudomonas sp. HR96]WPO98284.1 LysR family transcriptional regulator [Pseudomonas sp. HR96]
MLPTLDIELVRTFHAVARIGKFRAAAQYLHKSPAAISVHIQRLEAVAGGRLLERDNQAVSVTALGERLLAATAELLHTHDRIVADLHGAQLAGRIKLGVPDEYAAHVIGDILPLFAAHWPAVILEVTTAPSYSLREQVLGGKLDMVVMARPRQDASEAAQVLCAAAPVWVAALAGQAEHQRPLPLALYGADCPYRRAMLQALQSAGREWRVVLDSPSSQAIGACVEAGLAVGLMDRAYVSPRMRLLDGLPAIAEHEVVLLRAPSGVDQACERLAEAIGQHFRL